MTSADQLLKERDGSTRGCDPNELTAGLLLWSWNVTLGPSKYRLNVQPLCLGISCGTTSTTRFGIAVTRFGYFGFFLTHDICVTVRDATEHMSVYLRLYYRTASDHIRAHIQTLITWWLVGW